MTFAQRRADFRRLHQSGCFLIPNPWDGYGARALAKAGFKALASTSAGAAWALGKQDGEMTVEEVLAHLRFLCSATDLPVNADFEDGLANDADGVVRNVTACIDTGVAGVSIEDAARQTFYPMVIAVERLSAARAAIDRSGEDVMLVGRCEAYLMQPFDLDEVIGRLRAYSAAGADVLYAPGLRRLDDIRCVVEAVDKPVNANLTATGLSLADLEGAGVRRVSVGGALARATYDALDGFVTRLAGEGRLP